MPSHIRHDSVWGIAYFFDQEHDCFVDAVKGDCAAVQGCPFTNKSQYEKYETPNRRIHRLILCVRRLVNWGPL